MSTALKTVELTSEQQRKWEDTTSLMVWACPGFRHLWYKLLFNHNGKHAALFTEDDQIPIAATDGKNVIVKPSTFFELDLKERLFVLVHEIMHNVYDDCTFGRACSVAGEVAYPDGSKVPYDHGIMNKALDYRINDLIVTSRIGTMPSGKYAGLHDTAIGTANDSRVDIYKKLYKDGGGKGPGQGSGFDKVLQPGASTGQDPHTSNQQRNASQWAAELQVAKQLEAMKAQGQMSAGLLRMFEELLNPKISWTDHIRGFMARRVGSGSYDWRRPDRRLIVRDIYAPGRSGFGAGWVAVFGDVSGSIGPTEMNTYLGELSGIIEDVKPKRLSVAWFEDGISRIDDELDAGALQMLRHNGVPGGGGGTDVRPCFDWVADSGHEPPDAVIVLTDGLTPYPAHEPNYPVVWAMTTDVTAPFGEHVRIL